MHRKGKVYRLKRIVKVMELFI